MIELRHLRYFIAVAEELNFCRAAERIHIDQTPLSRTVRDLEDQCGVQLFARGPRKLRLTPAGACLLQEARKVLIRMERTRQAVQDTDARIRAPLRIGVVDGIAQPKLSECFISWRIAAPEIPLELSEMRATELAAALHCEEIDAAFSFGLPDDDTIVQKPAWHYPIMALLPAGHELTSAHTVKLVDLLSFPLLFCHARRQPGLHEQLKAIVCRHAAMPTFAGEAASLAGYVTRIAAGMGVGLADAGHLSTLSRNDVVSIPLVENELITTYVLYKKKRFDFPEPLQRFVAHAKSLY
jgi:DNA-binding transcriptional LysR family regulator